MTTALPVTSWVRELRQIRVYDASGDYSTIARVSLFSTRRRAYQCCPVRGGQLVAVYDRASTHGQRQNTWRAAGYAWRVDGELYGSRSSRAQLDLLAPGWVAVDL